MKAPIKIHGDPFRAAPVEDYSWLGRIPYRLDDDLSARCLEMGKAASDHMDAVLMRSIYGDSGLV